MLDTIFSSATTASEVSILPLLACTLACLVYGGGLACVYGHAGHRSASFMMALAVLPAIVCIVIALVNGNVGAGVAVAGTFSLVRFRSAPGTGRNIAFVFLAMAIGLVAGMGYVALAGIVTLILGGAFFVLQEIAARRGDSRERMLRITVPEDLDYMDAFEDVLARSTSRFELEEVKTTNMGSLCRLTYRVSIRPEVSEKQLIDAIRVRNDNLEVSLSHREVAGYEL